MNHFNKICASVDWDDTELSGMMAEIPHPYYMDGDWRAMKHRKHWEWSIGMLAMKKLGKLNGESLALGVGAGSEFPVFYLTKHVKYVFSTDLYSTEGNKWKESDAKMLTAPEKFAPYTFNRRRLGVQYMNGTEINFEDNTFDMVFSYSSIEHFGSKDAAAKSMKEIERVLKPGGVASITTEIFIGDNDRLKQARAKYASRSKVFNRLKIFSEMFTREEIDQYLVHSHRMKLYDEIDYQVVKSDIDGAVKYPPPKKLVYPHIFLDQKGINWGSIHLLFVK